jgi:alkanesulfonate monooxygenase SsuD/methylene tetrahydromethanopterin reductase-like flavin-dependent oxidoreductase (luciferase family)
MRLALSLGYQTAWTTPADHLALAQEADRLGYAVVWSAEAYGSDSVTMLAWIAGQTSRIDLGTAVMQIPARTPAMTAMTAATLDTLSGGRFRLGLGVSGPQVSEGWHGVRFAKPLQRTREYVESVRPARDRVPIYLAAVGPKNLELAGELADGWLAVFLAPEFASEQLISIAAGRAKAGLGLDGFDVVPAVPVVVGDDVSACAELVRWYAALYVGGMGSREQNFYNQLAVRMGYADAAREVQDLYLAKQHRDAAAAVPLEFIDRTSLLGPVERIAGRMREYAAAGVTTLSVSLFVADVESGVQTLRQVARALDQSGVGE